MTAPEATDNYNSRSKTRKYKDDVEFLFQSVEFADKRVIQIFRNGEIDCTMDIQVPAMVGETMLEEDEEDEETHGDKLESKIKASFIVGDTNNLKMLILATQLGKLILTTTRSNKPVILSASSKVFGRGDQPDADDFNVLLFILESVKTYLLQ